MTHSTYAAALLLAPLLAAGAQGMDDPRYPASALPPVLVFADTVSARVQVHVPGGAALAGRALRGTLTDAGTGAVAWQGPLGTLRDSAGSAVLAARVAGLRRAPKRWSPASPNLYRLRVEGDGFTQEVRFGFRTVSAVGGRIYLNGRPIFLRGNAINPPERNIPDSLDEDPRFIRDYLGALKAAHVNWIRLTRPSQPWFDAADELGMMLFQGHYGSPPGGNSTTPSPDLAAAVRHYRDRVLGPQVNHPSVVVYVLTNEVASPEISYLSKNHQAMNRFLTALHDSLRRWDGTRLYIGNAGYGFGRAGEVCDLHRYWGWYYNTALSFYTLRDPKLCWRSDAAQPITLSENTGNYTAADGQFNLVSATKQPDSQLNWTGHAPLEEQGERALRYQAWVAKQAIEITRRLRAQNPYLAGLSPFTIAFHDWWGIGRFADMKPKPVVAQYAISYQPILLSWELWTPQVYAGSTIRPVVHVVNDADSGESLRGLRVRWTIVPVAGGRAVAEGGRVVADVPYFASKATPFAIQLPAEVATGEYELRGVLLRGRDTLSRNSAPLFIAGREYADAGARRVAPVRRLRLLDPRGETRRALATLAIASAPVTVAQVATLDPARDALLVGTRAWTAALASRASDLRRFVAAGGRVLILAQDPASFDGRWLPAPVQLQAQPIDHPLLYPEGRPYRNGLAVNPERPDHPALLGIDRDRLFLWSDFSRWTVRQPGFPEVYPVTQGFVITDPATLAHADILASYDHGLQGIGLAELHDGRGSFVVSGFGLTERAGLDPVADRLLKNLVLYTTGAAPEPAHPLVEGPIRWGDYASERGIVPEIYSGFLVHTSPRVPATLEAAFPKRYEREFDANGFEFAGPRGGWNTQPAVQYLAGAGRRPYGPYRFSLGGAVQLPPKSGPEGEAQLWFRIPAGRSVMQTRVRNPDTVAHALEITVNGTAARHVVPPGGTATLDTPLAGSPTSIALAFRGDRRLIVLETSFR
jgi:hypothetical protein